MDLALFNTLITNIIRQHNRARYERVMAYFDLIPLLFFGAG
jgi:hypothetical protein